MSETKGWGEAPTEQKEWGDLSTQLKTTTLSDNTTVNATNAATSATPVTTNATHANANTTTTAEVGRDELKEEGDSHLYASIHTFEEFNLHPDLLKGIYSLGYQKPSKIQATALPLLLSNPPKNMIAQSQAGTGKTAAFSLNILQRILTTGSVGSTQALVVAPARELARQILDNIRDLGKYTTVTTTLAVPGAVDRGAKVLEDVVVGTPGTIMDLVRKRQLDLSRVSIFVLDEADSMLSLQGLGDTSLKIKAMVPKDAQVVLFSATFPEEVINFANKAAPNSNKIELKQEELSVDSITQFYMDCKDSNHKAQVLCDIYGLLTIGSSIIFERRTADFLHQKMESEGHKVSSLHGNFEAQDRDKAIDDFREGRCKVLITTNVLARGIDILQVNLVINYDIPLTVDSRPDYETYIHRIGRTGRFGRQGVSINFCHDKKSFLEMKEIEAYIGKSIIRVPTDNLQDIEKILKSAL